MHHISFSSGSSNFNYPTPVQEAQNRFASAPANSPPPATTTSIAQASEGQQRPVAMPSMQARLLRLRQAVDAQREDINTQAGPSNNPHLNALNHLEQRDFEPAAGGIEIPFTPNSLLGGGGSKRVDTRGTTSRHVQVCLPGVIEERIEETREGIRAQQEVLDNLGQNWANATDQGERSNIFQQMRQAQQHLNQLNSRLEALVNER